MHLSIHASIFLLLIQLRGGGGAGQYSLDRLPIHERKIEKKKMHLYFGQQLRLSSQAVLKRD